MAKRNKGNGGKSKCGRDKRRMDNKPHPDEHCTTKPSILPDDEYEAQTLAYETYYGILSPSIPIKADITDDLFPKDSWKPISKEIPFPLIRILTQEEIDRNYDQRRILPHGENNFMN